MRKLLGVLIGAAIGLAVVAGLAKLNLYLFPWPAFDWQSPEAWGAALARAPMTAHALAAGSWTIATLVGGLIAVRAAGWSTAGWMVTVLMAFAGVVSALFVPQPMWMQVIGVVSPFAAGLVVAGAS